MLQNAFVVLAPTKRLCQDVLLGTEEWELPFVPTFQNGIGGRTVSSHVLMRKQSGNQLVFHFENFSQCGEERTGGKADRWWL